MIQWELSILLDQDLASVILMIINFRHNFQECLNPLCLCKFEAESTRYSLFIIRKILLDTIKKITNISVSNLSDEYLVNHLMYGNPSYSF